MKFNFLKLFRCTSQFSSLLVLAFLDRLLGSLSLLCNRHLNFTQRPVLYNDFHPSHFLNNDCSDLGIVLQGPLTNPQFIVNTIRLYQNFVFPNSKIVVSTWNDESYQAIKLLLDLGVIVLLNKKPKNRGHANINYQICSSREGLKHKLLQSCKYLIKTRTDQRINSKNSYKYLTSLLKIYPFSMPSVLGRIIAISRNSFKYRIYGLSDMFYFGYNSDMIKLWDIPYDSRTASDIQKYHYEHPNMNLYQYARQCYSEVYIVVNYLQSLGITPLWSIAHSFEIISRYFIVIDCISVDLYWNKYNNRENIWLDYTSDYFINSEYSHLDWLLGVNQLLHSSEDDTVIHKSLS